MVFKVLKYACAIALFVAFFTQGTMAQQAKVTGLRSAKGKLIITIFNDAKAFDEEQPSIKYVVDKKNVNNGTMLLDLKVKPGAYGFVVVDDENGSSKMEKNFIGIPKEGIAFSDFYMSGMKKPAFADFRVEAKPEKTIIFKVRYF